jgi:hypothetical protein
VQLGQADRRVVVEVEYVGQVEVQEGLEFVDLLW